MKLIVLYLIIFLAVILYLFLLGVQGVLPAWLSKVQLLYDCVLIGGAGGCLYCLRGIYLTVSVRKNWDDSWQVWYYVRPIVSLICGGLSYLFLKAGLLVLESSQKPDSSDLGFLALAFIAGLNVDKFISKVEDVAQAAWGIEKSRTSKESE